ncbi:MAG: hypothetical protein K0U98_09575 [Deltaproteobacteria bacterium]|nr:hypothetical protein [Deltaproteobacteria bacterium]
MIPLVLTRETPQELVFAHKPVAGWVLAGVGASLLGGLIWLAGGDWRELFSFDSSIVFGTAICSIVVVLGVFLGLWRDTFSVDRRRRHWVRNRGLWFLARQSEGALGPSCQVALSLRRPRRSGQNRSYPIQLKLGSGESICLGAASTPMMGQELMVEMARRLELPTVDQTGSSEVVTPWEKLRNSD